jgi:hypothetical protein
VSVNWVTHNELGLCVRRGIWKKSSPVQKPNICSKVHCFSKSSIYNFLPGPKPSLAFSPLLFRQPRLHKTPCWLPLYGFENRVFQNRLSFWDSEETPQNRRPNAAENKLQVLKMSPPKFLDGRKIPSAATFASTVHRFEA